MRLRLPLLVSTTFAAVLIAGAATAEEPASSDAPAATEPAKPTLAQDMRSHFAMATGARDAVIQGDLAGARVWAQGLAESEAPANMPRKWRPLYAEMQVAASAVTRADSLEAAGPAVGRLGLTCSECHDFTGGGPKAQVLPLPPQEFPKGEGLDMALHNWTSNWMWIGLLSDDSTSWNRGAKALEAAPFHDRPEVPMTEKGVAQLEQLVHIIPTLDDNIDRATMAQRYGELITACAICHSKMAEHGLRE